MPFWWNRNQTLVACRGAGDASKWTGAMAMPTVKNDMDPLTLQRPRTGGDKTKTLPLPVQASVNQSLSSCRARAPHTSSLAVSWAKFKRRLVPGTPSSTTSFIEEAVTDSAHIRMNGAEGEDGEVNEIVVDRIWSEDFKGSATHSITQSDRVESPEKSGVTFPVVTSTIDQESLSSRKGWTTRSPPLAFLRWRLRPIVVEIFCPKFENEKSEQSYAQENWLMKKSLAGWAALWLILNWVLGVIFANPIVELYDKIYYYGIAPLFSLPILLLVIFDWPRDRSTIYQTVLMISIWCWPFYEIIFMYLCGYYPNSPHVYASCQGRDFLVTFYYTTALQAIALFGLKLNRLPAAVGASLFFITACSLMIPLKRTWVRTMINFFVFHGFLIYVHYMRESSERRLYTLRDQLKIQFKATQKAQINEKTAADSKRRLTSYVRVPLNTALLAVQNMEASGAIAKEQELEFNALGGSLSMMSKVLNDVLDFNRMDSGKLESVNRPYGFHQVIKSLFIPLRLATNARGLEFNAKLDPRIDEVARRAAYEALGETPEAIDKHIAEYPDVEGIVMGDESRLRQIITNLASNACKFTSAGGKLTIATKLILPTDPDATGAAPNYSATCVDAGGHPLQLSMTHLSHHNNEHVRRPVEFIVVRIEVTDTGVGIKSGEQTNLFSAFNQTEQGRQQGGKGTGLGLALVRQIVKLSNGRLGVRSKVGEGSTFWVELPLGIGTKTIEPAHVLQSESEKDSRTIVSDTIVAVDGSKSFGTLLIGNSFTMAADVAALKASHAPSISSQCSTAFHSLMEQGGRVELVLKQHESRSTIPHCAIGESCDSSAGQASRIATPQPSLPQDDYSTSDGMPKIQARRRQRPTHVPIPKPLSFQIDSQPTSNSDMSQRSSEQSSDSVLAQFDASFSRVSPSSSSPALNIEPGLPVLVVDDDPLTRTLMRKILTRLGCQVSTAENGEMALEMILGPHGLQVSTPSTDASGNLGLIFQRQEDKELYPEDKYAVVFLDNQMPVLSGIKTVQKLRALGRKDLIVGVTGNALLTDQQEYLDAGVDRVLTKPVLERSLRDVLVVADDERRKIR